MNNSSPEEIGKRISALSNGACLVSEQNGFLVYGVEDSSKLIKGTKSYIKSLKIGNEEIEHWLVQRLNPRIDVKFYDFEYEGKKISILKIPAAVSQPVRFINKAYIRVGSITRDIIEFPEKEKKIWRKEPMDSFESGIALNNINLSDLQNYLNFDIYFELLELPIPITRELAIEKFLQESLIIQNGNNFAITNLGAILFAKDLNNFPLLFK